MNKNFGSLLFKLLWYFVAGWMTFGFMEDNLLMWLVLLAIIASIVNFVVGDIIALPRVGSLPAAVVDGFLAILVAYIIDISINTFTTTFLTLIIYGVIIALAEYFYHKYLVKESKMKMQR